MQWFAQDAFGQDHAPHPAQGGRRSDWRSRRHNYARRSFCRCQFGGKSQKTSRPCLIFSTSFLSLSITCAMPTLNGPLLTCKNSMDPTSMTSPYRSFLSNQLLEDPQDRGAAGAGCCIAIDHSYSPFLQFRIPPFLSVLHINARHQWWVFRTIIN